MYRPVKKRITTFQDYIAILYPSDTMATKNVTWVVTEKCNLNCSYCYEVHKCDKRMTKEIGFKGVDMIFDEYQSNSDYINSRNANAIILEFIGGEPLLEIDLIEDIIEYFKYRAISIKHPWSINYMISMTTNGILYNTPKVQKFVEKYKNNLSITITIDGNKELHDACRLFPDGTGSYDIVEKAIINQVANKSEVATKLTLAPENIAYLVDAFKNLERLGIKHIHANCIFEKGWEIEHAKVFYDKLKELSDYMIDSGAITDINCILFDSIIGHSIPEYELQNWCGGTGAMLAISTDGDLYPCLRYLPFTIQNDRPAMIIGNVVEGIASTVETQEKVDCLNCITRKTQSTDECFNCPIASGCAWCSAYNYDEFGTADKRATYICIMHKARVLANVYFWNKWYREDGVPKRFKNNVPKDWALQIISEEEFDMLNALAAD